MTSAVQTDKTLICSSCHSPNNLDARFCNNCGATLPLRESAPAIDTLVVSNEAGMESQIQQDPLIGRIIENKYRIDSVIGAGGMGAVYQAHRLLIGDEVAIKILHTERVIDPHASERFSREARAAARLKHPNAVSIYDFGVSSDGLQYLVMELIEGKSLREFAKQHGPLDPSLAAEVTSQVCAALDEAHRQHIVHRDIKPDNVILNSTAAGLRVKVLDFGIAKLRDDTASHLTQTGSVMGTPHYMSPEQCLGEELDNRADIYSVAVVLYEMLCGRVPFNSPISTAVVVQHVNQPPPPLRAINPGISPQMEAAVLHALEKRREARPQTANAFAREVMDAAGVAIVRHRDQWNNRIAQTAVEPRIDDERTVERRREIAAHEPQKISREMAPTVHLASLSGSTAVIPGRSTAGSGAVPTATVRQGVTRNYVIVALGTLLCVSVVIAIVWLLSQSGTANKNSPANAEASKEDNSVNASNASISTKGHANPSPPLGMLYLNSGTFVMGSDEGDQYSKPAHTVSLRAFFIDIDEVTCEQYKKCVDAGKCIAPTTWSNGSYPVGDEHRPVTGVSWDDANSYARWAGKRLPTEEEWEYAARGPKSLKYPWGNSWKPGCANADKEGEARRGMVDVGNYNCDSSSGAKDMIGNAWEWTSSAWAPYPGSRAEVARKDAEKVIRGGSWDTPKESATAILRAGYTGAGDKTGFRCAKDAP
jgi:serine/threonine-protein kinase